MNNQFTKLIDEEKIQNRVKEIAKSISDKFKEEPPIMICVLNGAAMFYSDLIRNLDIDIICEFLSVSSYGNSTVSSGEVSILCDVKESLKNRHVVLVEDIVDTGLTMSCIQEIINSRSPKSLTTITLMLKPKAIKRKCQLDHVGFEIENEFVVGYGIDHNGYHRGLPYIGKITNIN